MYIPDKAPALERAQIVRPTSSDRHHTRRPSLPAPEFYRRLARPGEPWDIASVNWESRLSRPADINAFDPSAATLRAL